MLDNEDEMSDGTEAVLELAVVDVRTVELLEYE